MIPITPRSTEHLTDWCRTYQFRGTVPQPGNIRFGIGVYQITQGMSWEIGSPVRWQSFCAAAMHFIMCAEAYGVSVAAWLPEQMSEIPEATGDGIWRNLLMAVGKAQQQIIYHPSISAGSTRASRFKPEILRSLLWNLTENCFALTPGNYREQGCFDEMKILLGDLPEKRHGQEAS